jgi:hypothetical protein
MNNNTRIESHDSVQSAAIKMCEGNPGALSVIAKLITEGASIDPDATLGGIANVLGLDSLGIYGSRIWMLYKDVCGEDLKGMIAVLRAHQLGYITEAQVLQAIDFPSTLNVEECLSKVTARLPNFGKS